MSHLLCECIASAHHNTFKYKQSKLKGSKLVGELLAPHLVNLLAINSLAREYLVAKNGDQLSEFFGIQSKYIPQVIAEWYHGKE